MDKMREAFEALEILKSEYTTSGVGEVPLPISRVFKAELQAIESALAQQGEQEPVAWLCEAGDGENKDACCTEFRRSEYERFGRKITPLYTRPQPAIPGEWRAVIQQAAGFIRNVDTGTGYCCCGIAMDKHTFGGGHSPVDAGDYAAGNMIIELEDLLNAAPEQPAAPAEQDVAAKLLDSAKGCMDNYLGGYHDQEELEIFQHGMQTVINAVEHMANKLKRPAPPEDDNTKNKG